jgi:hypothetical protein
VLVHKVKAPVSFSDNKRFIRWARIRGSNTAHKQNQQNFPVKDCPGCASLVCMSIMLLVFEMFALENNIFFFFNKNTSVWSQMFSLCPSSCIGYKYYANYYKLMVS